MLLFHPKITFKQGILKVTLGLTYECQCSCTYCCSGVYPKIAKDVLSARKIESLIDEISSLPSVFTLVSFFGGEPLLREDIYRLVRYATKNGLFTELETNGILLSSENVKRLKKAGLHHIFVRIENVNSKIHDEISSFDSCFEKAIEGVKHCIAEKLSCSISTIATKEKIYNKELQRVINLGENLGATSIRILYPTLAGNWLNENSQLLNEDEKGKVGELLEQGFVYLESTYSAKKEIGRICPSAQKKFFYISPYGEIQPCPFVPFKFGNVRLENLDEILDKMWQYPKFNNTEYHGCLVNDKKFHNTQKFPKESHVCFKLGDKI